MQILQFKSKSSKFQSKSIQCGLAGCNIDLYALELRKKEWVRNVSNSLLLRTGANSRNKETTDTVFYIQWNRLGGYRDNREEEDWELRKHLYNICMYLYG